MRTVSRSSAGNIQQRVAASPWMACSADSTRPDHRETDTVTPPPGWSGLSGRFLLNTVVKLDSFLLAEGQLGIVQNVLARHAPRWSAGLHVWRHRGPKAPIPVSVPGALHAAVREEAGARGQLYQELVERYGAPR